MFFRSQVPKTVSTGLKDVFNTEHPFFGISWKTSYLSVKNASNVKMMTKIAVKNQSLSETDDHHEKQKG